MPNLFIHFLILKTSVFRGSAWEYNTTRQQFYLHQFAFEQPDLNFRNPLVIQEMVNVMNFWLELGVDGFRLDAAPHLLEDDQFRDNPPAKTVGKTLLSYTEEDYCFWDHVHTCNCSGVLDILTTFRKVCDQWSSNDHERYTGYETNITCIHFLCIHKISLCNNMHAKII